jgi:hypothetical protein
MAAAAASGQPAPAQNDPPQLAEIARYSAFKDSSLARLSKVLTLPDTWSFRPAVAGGGTVSINLSKTLYSSSDSAVAQQWADFFAGLVHGSELSALRAYILAPGEIDSICGREALACYGGDRLLTPAEDPSANLSAEAVATHEYGHHVANHRLNSPWDALDYGTKRWASYMQVCRKARAGQLYPGAEDQQRYELNPGEGFAESYRVLNERQAGLTEAPWSIVTGELYPDSTALALLEQDVTSPWAKPTSVVRTGSVSKAAPNRSFVVSTPLDGTLRLTLRSAARLRFDLFKPSSARVAHRIGRSASISTVACGERAFRIRLSWVSGAGSFHLTISRP